MLNISKYQSSNPTWTLAVITAIYALAVLDRYLLGILLPQVKEDLLLSDSLLGLLTGAAFAIFYATLGLPIARIADRYGRKIVIITSLFIFSVMTALCGLAVGFVSLFLARVGVGIGEAGTSPPSISIISDMYDKAKRSTGMAIMAVGGNVGVLIGFILGGFLAANYGWRTAFIVVGIPGVLLAIIMALTVEEPKRERSQDTVSENEDHVGLVSVIKCLWGQKSYRFNLLGISMLLFLINGVLAWLPSYLSRSHQMPINEIGLTLGLLVGVGGILGSLVAGVLATEGGKALIAGNGKQFVIQAIAIVVVALYAFLITFILVKVLDKAMGIRVTERDEINGLDETQHGETGYNL